MGKGICYLCIAPIRTVICKISYYRSPFFKLTKIRKEEFHNGSSWCIANDQRYIVCNAIAKKKLPLLAVSAEEPDTQEESLMYYFIYNNTLIITHGFFRAVIENHNAYYIIRDYNTYPEEYDKSYSVPRFYSDNWIQFIRPEHQHLPIKVLHSNSRYKFQGRHTDTYDQSTTGIFYRNIKDLKKIFK